MSASPASDHVGQLLIGAARDPAMLQALESARWEALLSCARRNSVLAYLGHRASEAGVLETLPEAPRYALRSALTASQRLAQLAMWELEQVRRALATIGMPMIALKGVAYLLRGLPHASSRMLSDIDVMVPRDGIAAAERALLSAGWRATNLDPYDQAYYRRWSHEIPPLQYPGRVLAVDVHHTICPPVSRLRPDPELFWRNSSESTIAGVGMLDPVDMFLHAAVHLFFDSDMDSRFRDLIDLHEMASGFDANPASWGQLVEQTRRQGLQRPVYYALDALAQVLRTHVPADTLEQVREWGPPAPLDAWMKATMRTLLMPIDPSVWPPPYRLRRGAMYVRSHWLRMPPHLLLPHLLRKSLRRVHPAAEA